MIPNLGDPTLAEYRLHWFRQQSWLWFAGSSEPLHAFEARMGWAVGSQAEWPF